MNPGIAVCDLLAACQVVQCLFFLSIFACDFLSLFSVHWFFDVYFGPDYPLLLYGC